MTNPDFKASESTCPKGEEGRFTTWRDVDALVRFVAENRPQFWVREVRWLPVGCYQITFLYGPGISRVTVRACRTFQEVLDLMDWRAPDGR